jgi:hypothetical protein
MVKFRALDPVNRVDELDDCGRYVSRTIEHAGLAIAEDAYTFKGGMFNRETPLE